MKYRSLIILLALVVLLAACSAEKQIPVENFTYARSVSPEEAALRDNFVATATAWLGTNEADGSHKAIIDLYNGHTPLAQGYTVKYDDEWCATFVSAVAIECDLTDIIPTECSCERQIGLWQEISRWEEHDDAIPLPGDIIYYNWDQKKPGENSGWSDHVGIVVGTKWPFVKVIEGNYDDQVKYRVLLLGDYRIRGYGKPDYCG